MAAATTATTAAHIVSSPSRGSTASLAGSGNGNTTNGQGSPQKNGGVGFGRGHVRNNSSIATTLDTTMVANGGLLFETDPRQKAKQSAVDKARQAQLTFAKMVQDSLNPSVQETEDYERYISHPQNLQIVVSTDEAVNANISDAISLSGGIGGRSPATGISAASNEEYQEYVNGSWKTDGLGMSIPEPSAASTSTSANFPSAALASSIPSLPGLDHPDDELAVYGELLRVPENPLTVTEGDAQKKRYKAYRKWLRGKSLFKQQMVDA